MGRSAIDCLGGVDSARLEFSDAQILATGETGRVAAGIRSIPSGWHRQAVKTARMVMQQV